MLEISFYFTWLVKLLIVFTTSISFLDVDGILESKLLQHNDSFSESLKYLQEHGITMLPVDEDTILSSAMETGHSVVLTGLIQLHRKECNSKETLNYSL